MQKQVALAKMRELYCVIRLENDALDLIVSVTFDGINVANSPFVISENHDVSFGWDKAPKVLYVFITH